MSLPYFFSRVTATYFNISHYKITYTCIRFQVTEKGRQQATWNLVCTLYIWNDSVSKIYKHHLLHRCIWHKVLITCVDGRGFTIRVSVNHVFVATNRSIISILYSDCYLFTWQGQHSVGMSLMSVECFGTISEIEDQRTSFFGFSNLEVPISMMLQKQRYILGNAPTIYDEIFLTIGFIIHICVGELLGSLLLIWYNWG